METQDTAELAMEVRPNGTYYCAKKSQVFIYGCLSIFTYAVRTCLLHGKGTFIKSVNKPEKKEQKSL